MFAFVFVIANNCEIVSDSCYKTLRKERWPSLGRQGTSSVLPPDPQEGLWPQGEGREGPAIWIKEMRSVIQDKALYAASHSGYFF